MTFSKDVGMLGCPFEQSFESTSPRNLFMHQMWSPDSLSEHEIQPIAISAKCKIKKETNNWANPFGF